VTVRVRSGSGLVPGAGAHDCVFFLWAEGQVAELGGGKYFIQSFSVVDLLIACAVSRI